MVQELITVSIFNNQKEVIMFYTIRLIEDIYFLESSEKFLEETNEEILETNKNLLLLVKRFEVITNKKLCQFKITFQILKGRFLVITLKEI